MFIDRDRSFEVVGPLEPIGSFEAIQLFELVGSFWQQQQQQQQLYFFTPKYTICSWLIGTDWVI